MIDSLIKLRQYFRAGNRGLASVSKTFKGFTLIELLVVISIIGILAGMVLVNLNSARAKARDVKRLSDIEQIRLALEMYHDNFGTYPVTGTAGNTWRCLSSATCWQGLYSRQDSITTALTPYLSQIPDDPRNFTSCYGDDYLYNSDTTVRQRGAYLHWYFEQGPLSDKSCGAGFYGGPAPACSGIIGYCWLYLGT